MGWHSAGRAAQIAGPGFAHWSKPSKQSQEERQQRKSQKKGRFALQLLYGKCRRWVGGSLVKMFTQAVLVPVEFLENFWI